MNQNSTKRGVASLYVVIFATILFGVVTLSFMRIILSDAGQTSDDDLSRSAYDSAMAGVEDAKTAINRYYSCLSEGKDVSTCDPEGVLFAQNCDNGIGLAKYLYGYSDGEVLIQQNQVGNNADNNSDQAYTCVIISDEVPDYRGTLTSDTRTKVVPLGVYDGVNGGKLQGVDRIRFSWFSQVNMGTDRSFNVSADGKLPKASDGGVIPPVISLSLIRFASNTSLEQFNTAETNANYSTVILLPSQVGGSGNTISYTQLIAAGNTSSGKNEPVQVSCSTSSEFACTVDLTGLSFSNTDSAFLVVSLPYGDTVSDFSSTLFKGNDRVDLKGAQISVDSTGRTNQLVRRVETRLDPADLYFPYPQYELELTGGEGGDSIKKKFWITANCWKTDKGGSSTCPNNSEIK